MKKLIGKIIQDKSDKTCLVELSELRHHPIYKKAFKRTSKILAHDEKNEYKIGDEVEIVAGRPISKNKSWVISRKVK